MVVVAALAGLLFGLRLGERALWSEEVRWAQIPREMLSTLHSPTPSSWKTNAQQMEKSSQWPRSSSPIANAHGDA